MTTSEAWTGVASTTDLEEDDVIEVTVRGKIIAIYRTRLGYFASDGICTHQLSRLSEGFVFDNIIECAKHQGRFDVRTGAPKGAPVHLPLKTYPVRVMGSDILIDLGSASEDAL
jgi:3-phenylpropionate/trans-cinnamate dioxygenase ferredoxin component